MRPIRTSGRPLVRALSAVSLTKSLSVNNICRHMDFPERDDRRSQMGEAEEAAREFLIPHEQFAKASEPAMGNLYNPSPGSLRRMPPLLVDFLPASFDVGNVAMCFHDALRHLTSIARISTQVFAASRWRRGPLNHHAVQDRSQLADIMPVGSGHDDRQRDATPVHQQVAFAAIFSPDPWGSARRRPEPAALSAWPRRYSAIATRCLPCRHIPPTRSSTGLRIPRLAATPDSAGESHSRFRSVRRAGPSTDTPCVRRTRWPRTRGARLWVCGPRRVGEPTVWSVPAGAVESRVRPAATRRPTQPMLAPAASSCVSPSLTSLCGRVEMGTQCIMLFTDKL